MLHVNPADPHRINVPPELKWVKQALAGGHLCLLQTIRTVSAGLQVGTEPKLAELRGDFNRAWALVASKKRGENLVNSKR